MKIIRVLKPTIEGGRQSNISPDGFRDNLLQNVMASQDERRGASGYKHYKIMDRLPPTLCILILLMQLSSACHALTLHNYVIYKRQAF